MEFLQRALAKWKAGPAGRYQHWSGGAVGGGGGEPPLRPRALWPSELGPRPGTDEGSDGLRRLEDPAQYGEDSQWLVLR